MIRRILIIIISFLLTATVVAIGVIRFKSVEVTPSMESGETEIIVDDNENESDNYKNKTNDSKTTVKKEKNESNANVENIEVNELEQIVIEENENEKHSTINKKEENESEPIKEENNETIIVPLN